MDNTVNDLSYEIKFENGVKDVNNLFVKRNNPFLFQTKKYLILEDVFFYDSFAFFFFLLRQILKKDRHVSAKESNAAW